MKKQTKSTFPGDFICFQGWESLAYLNNKLTEYYFKTGTNEIIMRKTPIVQSIDTVEI